MIWGRRLLVVLTVKRPIQTWIRPKPRTLKVILTFMNRKSISVSIKISAQISGLLLPSGIRQRLDKRRLTASLLKAGNLFLDKILRQFIRFGKVIIMRMLPRLVSGRLMMTLTFLLMPRSPRPRCGKSSRGSRKLFVKPLMREKTFRASLTKLGPLVLGFGQNWVIPRLVRQCLRANSISCWKKNRRGSLLVKRCGMRGTIFRGRLMVKRVVRQMRGRPFASRVTSPFLALIRRRGLMRFRSVRLRRVIRRSAVMVIREPPFVLRLLKTRFTRLTVFLLILFLIFRARFFGRMRVRRPNAHRVGW